MPTGRSLRRTAAAALVAVVAPVLVLVVAAQPAGAQDDDPSLIDVRPVVITADEPDEVRERPILDELAPSTVLEIIAAGFPAGSTGAVAQCSTADQRACSDRLPVNFDDRGRAIFQFLVRDGEGRCRLDATRRCTLEVEVGSTRTVVDLVFVDAAPPPGRLRVSPRTGIEIGQQLSVEATGFPPDVALSIRVCAAPATEGARCGPPGPARDLVTDPAGEARAELAFDGSPIGADGVACGRRTPCHLVVDSDAVGVRATPVPLGFVTVPGADYDGTRLLVGLVIAGLLVAVAISLARSVDWGPPAEADGSAIDDAELADLDAEAARFEEEEQEEPIGSG